MHDTKVPKEVVLQFHPRNPFEDCWTQISSQREQKQQLKKKIGKGTQIAAAVNNYLWLEWREIQLK